MNSKVFNAEYESSIFKNCLYKEIGRLIRAARKELGLTEYQMARILNVSQQQISRYERGLNRIDLNKLLNLSLILNIREEELLNLISVEYKNLSSRKFKFEMGC